MVAVIVHLLSCSDMLSSVLKPHSLDLIERVSVFSLILPPPYSDNTDYTPSYLLRHHSYTYRMESRIEALYIHLVLRLQPWNTCSASSLIDPSRGVPVAGRTSSPEPGPRFPELSSQELSERRLVPRDQPEPGSCSTRLLISANWSFCFGSSVHSLAKATMRGSRRD